MDSYSIRSEFESQGGTIILMYLHDAASPAQFAYQMVFTSHPLRPGQAHPDLFLCLFILEFCFFRLNLR